MIQECVGGSEVAWTQSTPASGEEPESPAPAVALGAAEGAHGAAEDGEAMVEAEPVSATDSDDDSGDGLAIAALIAGALGLLTGGAALITARRSKQ